ncbi:MaoC/PaaZ C-terminal domain-containing protein [Sphingopyxis granuli]|jgi:acyl dehydratase|uniref:MaoC/PaaZ C-terminal domain-containing protein n=1 Tax=Sphingopyxis granuli TaxID=267128 RepID=UPI001FD5FFE8|nr:MaoC/PaaZ C-terminal domain-containing protein [Sphingopyxis granuli]
MFIPLADLPTVTGKPFDPSPWVTIDEAMIVAFANVTRDHQWIHVDAERTAAAGHGLIAHGFLLLSLIPSLSDPMLIVTDATRALNGSVAKIGGSQR